jgi:hypothetical protein
MGRPAVADMTCISTFVPATSDNPTSNPHIPPTQSCLSSEVHHPLRAPARLRPSSNRSHKKPPSPTQDSLSRYHRIQLFHSSPARADPRRIRNSTNTASSAASPSPAPPCPRANPPATRSAWKSTCRPGTSSPSNTSTAYRERPVPEAS